MSSTYYHTFVLCKIKKSCKTDIVELSRIREIIGRVSIRIGGLPKQFTFLIVQDLLNLGLISRISNDKYRILKSPLEQKVKALLMSC